MHAGEPKVVPSPTVSLCLSACPSVCRPGGALLWDPSDPRVTAWVGLLSFIHHVFPLPWCRELLEGSLHLFLCALPILPYATSPLPQSQELAVESKQLVSLSPFAVVWYSIGFVLYLNPRFKLS